MLLLLPGTDDGTLLPINRRTFLSLNFPGDERNCLGKTGGDSGPFAMWAGQFSLGLSEQAVLNRGWRKGRIGDPT